MSLQIQKLVPEAILPSLPTSGAAGYDLYAYTDCIVEPGRRIVVPLGFTTKLPEGVYGRIAPRTGLAVKHGLNVLGGVVDPDYTGEMKVILHNTDRYPFVIHSGYRIAQLILERYETPSVHEIETIDLTKDAETYYKVCGV
jgi:dUTP pyrophosphatase